MDVNVPISACLIVRNEADLLEGCLESIRGATDEIIVVDTGSTDDTTGVAARAGARVFCTQWRDSFAVARNEALDRAVGRWVLSIDADERLDAHSVETVRRLAHREGACAFDVMIRSPLAECDRGEAEHVGYYPRFFRCLPGVRYEGRVHEQIVPSLHRTGLPVLASDIVIHHLGYSLPGDAQFAKRERNLRLLKRQIEDDSRDGFAMYCLASLYDEMGEDTSCVTWCRQSIAVAHAQPKAHFLLGTKLLKLDRPAEALGAFRNARDLAPDVPEPHYNMAVAAVRLKEYALAAESLTVYSRLRPSDEQARRLLAGALFRAQQMPRTEAGKGRQALQL